MATSNLTVSLDEDVIRDAKRLAAEAGISVSAWINKAAKHERMRVNGRRYREYMASLEGEDAEFRDSWIKHVFERGIPSEAA